MLRLAEDKPAKVDSADPADGVVDVTAELPDVRDRPGAGLLGRVGQR